MAYFNIDGFIGKKCFFDSGDCKHLRGKVGGAFSMNTVKHPDIEFFIIEEYTGKIWVAKMGNINIEEDEEVPSVSKCNPEGA